jgi:hypothetical protein
MAITEIQKDRNLHFCKFLFYKLISYCPPVALAGALAFWRSERDAEESASSSQLVSVPTKSSGPPHFRIPTSSSSSLGSGVLKNTRKLASTTVNRALLKSRMSG